MRKRNDVSRDQVKHDLKLGVLFLLELFSVLVERLDRLILLLDWDNPQLLPLTSAVLVLALYLQENPKVWARPHCRPVFAIRRIEGSRNLNKADPTDDVFTAVAELMNRIEVLLFREGRELVFPRIDCLDAERKGEKLTKKMGALREAFLLGQGQSHQGKRKGQGPFSAFGKWFGKRHWMERKGSEVRILEMKWKIYEILVVYCFWDFTGESRSPSKALGNPPVRPFPHQGPPLLPVPNPWSWGQGGASPATPSS